MIEVYHVSKSFQGRQALQDINLKIDKGEFVSGEPYIFFKDPDGYKIEVWYELVNNK